MRYIIVILILLYSLSIKAQQRFPSGFPTQTNMGWTKWGYSMSDSGLIVANRDTNWLAKYSGTVVFRPANKQFYWFDSTTLRWNLFGTTIDTTSLSNRINLKLNIGDTASMLLPYLRKADTANKWVQDVYVRNDSLFKFKNGTETFLDTLGGGGSGSGTVTSVALSMPSAFTVLGSPITTSGTFSVSGAGTALQYIRGNGTLATTDTGMIPDFHLKVRGLLTGTSPIAFNQTTGAIGINNANTSGTKGAATFSAAFQDNGSGTIDLLDLGAAGSCTGCNLNIDAKGRITGYADGPAGATNNTNIGAGFRWLNSATQEMRTVANSPTVTWDSVSTANTLTAKVDTSIIATQYDLSLLSSFSTNNIGAGFRPVATPSGNIKTFFGNNTITIDSSSNSNALTWKVDTSQIASQYDLTLVNNGLSRSADTTQLGGDLVKNTIINTGGFTTTWTGSNDNETSFSVVNTGATNASAVSGSAAGATSVGVSGTSTSYIGVLGTSTSNVGIQGQSTSSTGVVGVSSTGVAFRGQVNPVSTNAIENVVTLLRTSSSGAGANGEGAAIQYELETATNGTSQTAGLIAFKWTDAINATRTSQFEIFGVNNTTLARKAALTGAGQWVWDGYPALTAQVDTATYKPVAIDGSGNVVKMAGWAGSGGGGGGSSGLNIYNNDSTLAANRTVTQANRYLRFQNGIPYTEFLGGKTTIQPDSTSMPYYVREIKSPYAGTSSSGILSWWEGLGFGNQAPERPNYPYMRGWNLAAGGSAIVAGLPALGESWEPHYLPEPASPTLWLQEYHKYFIQTSGTQRRLESWTINTRDNDWNVYYTVPEWALRDTFSVDYLSASTASGTDRTTIVEQQSGNSTTRTQFVSNGTEDLFQIKSVSLGQLEFEGWTNIDFGNGNGYNVADDTWGFTNVSQGFNIIRATNPFGLHFKNLVGGGDITAITADNATGETRYFVPAGGYYQTFYSNGNEAMVLNTTGQIKFNLYGASTFQTIDTSYNALVVDGSGNIFKRSGTNGGAGGGITTLNTLTASTQTFATGTTGTDFNISSGTSTHTFNIPSASTSNRGLVTTTSQTFGGTKTFNEGIVVTSTSQKARLQITGDFSSSVAPGIAGVGMYIDAFTYTSSAAAGTESSGQNFNVVSTPTLTSTNAITYSGDVATFRFAGAPIAGGSSTIQHPYNILANDANYFQTIVLGLNEQSADQTIGNGSQQVYTGSGGNTWTLPALSTHPGKTYFVKNIGSGSLTIQRAGSDNIYTTSSVTSFTVAAGAAVIITAGSTFWLVQ